MKNLKSSFRSNDILNYCPDFFGHAGKRLDKKAKINLKMFEVVNLETKYCNAHIAQS